MKFKRGFQAILVVMVLLLSSKISISTEQTRKKGGGLNPPSVQSKPKPSAHSSRKPSSRRKSRRSSTPSKSKKGTRKKQTRRTRGQLFPDPARTQEIQQKLFEAGALEGTPNRIWNPKQMEEAIRRFQQTKGLPPTGKLDSKTLKQLGL